MVVAYLLGLMIIMVNVWGIKPFCLIPSDIYLVATVLYLFMGLFLFPRRRFYLFGKKMMPFWIIVAGVVLSMIPARIFYGQSLLQSVLTYRSFFLWISLPMLVRLNPSRKAVFQATLIFTVIMFALTLLHAVVPSLFMEPEGYNSIDEFAISGFAVSVIPLLLSLDRFMSSYSRLYLWVALFCVLFLFIVENRTALFAAICSAAVMILSANNKHRYIVFFVLSIFALVFVLLTANTWIEMLNETVTDLGDDNYNRNKAILYFTSPLANPSWLTYITGNGFLSGHSSPIVEDLQAEGVFNSDVGYIGFWNQYGLLPIFVFLCLIIKGLFSKSSDAVAKGCAVFMLLTSMTIGYYATESALVFFMFIYYYIVTSKKVRHNLVQSKTDDCRGQ